ncbi:MAG: DNA gyrase C-terminal beta-propeller domain-containing protein, partial [Bacteroidota bacterium]
DLMIINKSGITIRLRVSDLRVMGRATQGVRLINIQDGDEIAAVTRVDHDDEEFENESNPDLNVSSSAADESQQINPDENYGNEQEPPSDKQ